MPFAFAERVPSPDQLTTVPTPWAVAGSLTTPAPQTLEASERVVAAAQGSRHHHYYKKHMTMLGLRKELDSSDTDSETSENFQTKLFRRRHHKLKPVKTMADREREAVDARRAARPWEQLVAPLNRIGLKPTAVDDDPEDRKRLQDGVRKGKRVVGFAEAHDRVEGPPRKTKDGRQSRIDDHNAAVAAGPARTTLLNAWDEREAERESERRQFRLSGPRPTPDLFRAPPRVTPEPLSAAAAPAQQRRSHSSLSGATSLSITRTVRALRKDHEESMHRHRLIMARVGAEDASAAPPVGAPVLRSPSRGHRSSTRKSSSQKK